MRQLTILLLCLIMGLTACGQANEKSDVETNSTEVESTEVTKTTELAEHEKTMENNESTVDNTEQAEESTEIETVNYEYTVPTFTEMFGVPQPLLKIFEKEVVLGTTTIQDLIGYNYLNDNDKYISGISNEIIPPYTAYEFILENVMYDATVTLYGYNLTTYYMPINILPVYGTKVNIPNMNEGIFHMDSNEDSIQLETEDFTFNYKYEMTDSCEALVELIPTPELAVKYMQATKGAYMPKDLEGDMELTETQFVIDGKVYDFNEIKYFHMTSFEKLPKLIVICGDTETKRTYEFDNECEFLVDGDTFFTFQFSDIFNNTDTSVNDMLDLYNLSPESIKFNILDQTAHEFRYDEFNSSNMKKDTTYDNHTDITDVTIGYVNSIQGIVSINDNLLPQEIMDKIKYMVSSN